MKHDLIVIGGGGLGREVIWLAQDAGRPWRVVGVLDDALELQGRTLCGVPVAGRIEDWQLHSKASFVLAVGAPRLRQAIARRMAVRGQPRYATLIHPSVRMSRYVDIGEGSIVAAGCILTTNVRIGRHAILDRLVNIGHDCTVGDFCTVSPLVPVGGGVTLGNGVWVGAGASIRQGLTMGSGSMAGLGAVVVKDVASNQLVAGNPARLLDQLEPFQT